MTTDEDIARWEEAGSDDVAHGSGQHLPAVASPSQTSLRRDRKGSNPSRVPPHNLEAEQAAIGAALLSSSAATEVVERLTPRDFYAPRHGLIFDAIRSTVAAGISVDPITVADQLRRAGLLDDVGGIGYLGELMNATPAISAVAHYSKIVADTSTLRRMLFAASDLVDAAYAETDPATAVARAQDALISLGTDTASGNGSTLDVADIAALLETNLEPESGLFLTRSDGLSLLYPGKMHVFQAEPSSGKSWIALHAVREVLDLGGAAIYLDLEDTPGGILRRLQALGTDPHAMRDRLAYAQLAGRYGTTERLEVDRMLDQMNPDLVVIDGVGESLSRNGLSEDKADDVLRWMDLLPRPIAATGAAVLMIDHVAKDPEQRGRWARGSGAKLGAVDGASYQVKLIAPFARNKAGAVKLVIAKDRPGGVGAIGDTAAVVKIEPHADGERVILSVEPEGVDIGPADAHKPTQVMATISREMEASQVPRTAKSFEATIGAKPRTIRKAIEHLLLEGHLVESPGKVKTLRLVRPYYPPTGRPDPSPPDHEPPPEALEMFPEHEPPDWIDHEHRESLDFLAYRKDPEE